MTERDERLRAAIVRPLRLDYHPVHRFYQGGKLIEQFRGLPEPRDHDRPEDWVGSCTLAANPDRQGRPQGLSTVEVDGVGAAPLVELVERFPEPMLGTRFVARWGVTPGVLVKLLGAPGRLPVHAHPSRAFAERHLGSRFGKTEAWIVLETHATDGEPAHVKLGFQPHVTRDWFRGAVERQDATELTGALHHLEVRPGDVYLVGAGMPHLIGPGILIAETQEPTDFGVLAEWRRFGVSEEGATMGLGWDVALDVFDYTPRDREALLAVARQQPRLVREQRASRETALMGPAAAEFFDASVLDVADELEVDDGRFYVGMVTAGDGSIEGDFGREPLRRGQTFACAASLGHRYRAGRAPLRVLRCLGPRAG